jgi:hypothetical protein
MHELYRPARFVETQMVGHAEKFEVRTNQEVFVVGNR